MSRFFGIIILIAVITIAVYLVLLQDNSSEYSFPILKGKEIISSTFQRVKDGGLDKEITFKTDLMVGDGVSSIIGKVADKIESVIENVVDNVKLETFKKIKNVVNDRVDSLGESAGINIKGISSSGGGKDETVSPVVYTIKSGDTAYFTIINRENRNINYEVDWQDGNTDKGTLDKEEKAVLSHKWDKEGEYLIKFKVITIGEEKEYQFSINIF